jgi:hypothetical protein
MQISFIGKIPRSVCGRKSEKTLCLEDARKGIVSTLEQEIQKLVL